MKPFDDSTKIFNFKINGVTRLWVWTNDWIFKDCRYKKGWVKSSTLLTILRRRYKHSDTTDRESFEIAFSNVSAAEHEQICKQLFEYVQGEKFINEL